MKVSGFSIIRNGIKYGYPFKEAILSVLPICDEFIINVGNSEDNTLDVIKSIHNDKIKIIEREWDMTLREGGRLLSMETNIALKKCTGDWCFYIQGDEVLHEKYLPPVNEEMLKYLNIQKIEGLQFRYKHFYGSYDYYQDNNRKWYVKEVRVIKNNRDIISWDDAMSFKHSDSSPIKSVKINAEIYHYGWVRPPDTMKLKRIDILNLYHPEDYVNQISKTIVSYDELGDLKKFTDTHPAVMLDRISISNWDFDPQLEKQLPDWLRKVVNFLHPLTKRIKKLFN